MLEALRVMGMGDRKLTNSVVFRAFGLALFSALSLN